MTLPPGPRAPSLVQIARWITRPLEMLEGCQRDFGDVFTFRGLRGANVVIVADPELIKQIFTADPATLLAGRGNAMILEPLLGKYSLLTLDGDEHLRQRRLLLPAFHGEKLRAWTDVMREITERSLAAWPVGQPFAVHGMMQAITLDVILRTVFGLENPERHGHLRDTLVELLDLGTKPWMMLPGAFGLDPLKVPWLRISRLKAALDVALYKVIAERRTSPSGDDVLSMMLGARDDSGRAMSDVELRDQLITLLLAGHETTATSLAWTFDQLLANPSVMSRLRDEIAAGHDEFLDAVIRETLRIRPILPLVGRFAAKPYQLGRWELPEGTQIAPAIYLAARNRNVYPDPERFKPERWLGVKPDPYTWLPFGGGIRRCIGMAFAQLEMRVVLQTVVPRVAMRLADGPARVTRRGISLAPTGGTRIVVETRRPRAARSGGDSAAAMIT